MFNDAVYFCITLLPIFISSFVNDSFRLKKKPTNPSLPLGLELYVFVYFNYSYNKILSLYWWNHAIENLRRFSSSYSLPKDEEKTWLHKHLIFGC